MTRDPMGGPKIVGPGKSFMERAPQRHASTLVPPPMLDDGTKNMMAQNRHVQSQVKTVQLQAELQRTRNSMIPTGQENYGLSREIANRGRRGF